MKQKLLIKEIAFCFCLLISQTILAQKKIDLANPQYGSKTYILIGTPFITKCNQDGIILMNDVFAHIRAESNSTFTLEGKQNDSTYIIKFKKWIVNKKGKNSLKFAKYNTTTTTQELKTLRNDTNISRPDTAYFLISKVDLLEYGAVYEPISRISIIYGTITYLARIRPKIDTIKGRWNTDLNLGFAIGPKLKLCKDWSVSALLGVSITKINLDSISTHGVVKSTNEKPSLTPSVNLLVSYKSVSLGVGLGWDFINKDSQESKAWAYNQKNFFAIGLGINIFSSSDTQTPKAAQD